MTKPSILLQIDGDSHASVFDAVVAVDSQVDQLLQYHGVDPEQVAELVHGAMFTRGPQDLHRTAIFIGGSDVSVGESLFEAATGCFFGPLRVSVMLDANGANTTAAAAVLAAAKHLDLKGAHVLVLAATGPVGRRLVRLLVREGAHVRAASRSSDRAAAVCDQIRSVHPEATLTHHSTASASELTDAIAGAEAVISAGAAGIELLPVDTRTAARDLQVAIDLNAVPPLGIAGLEVMDKGVDRSGVQCYGAIGVGGTKMKIHKACIAKLFESNDQLLDAEEILAIGRALG